MGEEDCTCAPGTCPEWEAKAEYMKEWRRRTGRTKRMLVPVTERNNP